ncbi:unnamed protein product [Meloidogyne enterolobii]|uniref:Uncharacterized protein n=1 Tax=Meloidogyne enterolobii TaxID=390850 RepID=A0ACB0YB95_MELEN
MKMCFYLGGERKEDAGIGIRNFRGGKRKRSGRMVEEMSGKLILGEKFWNLIRGKNCRTGDGKRNILLISH